MTPTATMPHATRRAALAELAELRAAGRRVLPVVDPDTGFAGTRVVAVCLDDGALITYADQGR